VDILVPRLFAVVRSSDIPTTLRTSSLSLLSTCVNTFPLAMLPYVEDLSSAMIDLLQIESVPFAHDHKPSIKTPTNPRENDSEPLEDSEPSEELQTMDSNPTSKNPKFPPLRRAAIHFLSLLIQAATRQLYDQPGTDISMIFPRILSRPIESHTGIYLFIRCRQCCQTYGKRGYRGHKTVSASSFGDLIFSFSLTNDLDICNDIE
jgi:hypothetical protein